MNTNPLREAVEAAARLNALPDPVSRFTELGLRASYHLADDSGRESGRGYDLKHQALAVFDAAPPEQQREMRRIACGFLWSLDLYRPEVQP